MDLFDIVSYTELGVLALAGIISLLIRLIGGKRRSDLAYTIFITVAFIIFIGVEFIKGLIFGRSLIIG